MPDSLESFCKIFVDDTKVYSAGGDKKDQEKLQRDLLKLSEWSRIWLLEFSVPKCKIVEYGNVKHHFDYKLLDKDGNLKSLPKDTTEKDLGIWFQNNMKFDEHITYVVNRCNKLLGLIKRTFKSLDKESFLTLYKTLIRSILDYGGSVYFPTSKKNIQLVENVQKHATKLLPEVKELSYKERLQRCVSSLQAILSTITGLIIAQTCQRNIMTENSILTNLYAQFGLPYFIYDIFAMYITYTDSREAVHSNYIHQSARLRVLQFLRNNKPMLAHHIILPCIFYPVILFFRRGLGDFFIGVFYCCEAAIPFISLRFILAQLNMKHTAAYIVSGLLMIVTFFIFRILVFPYLYWRYSVHAGLKVLEVPFRIPVQCNLGCLSVLVLQVYWMWLMVRGAYRAFYKIYQKRKSYKTVE